MLREGLTVTTGPERNPFESESAETEQENRRRASTAVGIDSFEEAYARLISTAHAIHNDKRLKYTGTDAASGMPGAALANYDHAGRSAGITTERAMLARVGEKVYRLQTLLGGPDATGIIAECLDAANILLLLGARTDTLMSKAGPQPGYIEHLTGDAGGWGQRNG